MLLQVTLLIFIQYHIYNTKSFPLIKHKTSKTTEVNMLSGKFKRDLEIKTNYVFTDKFDQFWAINRRLMESHGDNEGFKHIPIKLYSDDGTCSQRLVSPKNSDGSRKTLQQMTAELYPDKHEVQLRTHGIVIPPDTPLQWLSEHLSYPDNFLHIMCVF